MTTLRDAAQQALEALEKEAAHRAYIEAKRSLHSGCTI